METPSFEKTTQVVAFNEHSYHVFAKWFQRRRLKSKSLQTTDAMRAIRHMTFTFLIRVATHLVDSFWGGCTPQPRS